MNLVLQGLWVIRVFINALLKQKFILQQIFSWTVFVFKQDKLGQMDLTQVNSLSIFLMIWMGISSPSFNKVWLIMLLPVIG